jgi:putative methionine-R-sulfoxide reductase with GAF domain
MMKRQVTLTTISKIASRINSSVSLVSLLDSIIETTKEILESEGCSLLLYNKEKDALVFHTTAGTKKDEYASLEVPRGKGIAGMVLDTLLPEIVNDAENDPRIYKKIDDKVGFRTRNLIAVPMVAQGEVQGVLEAVNSIGREEFEVIDIKILKYISDLSAIAVRNRLLIDQLNLRAREMSCLYQISQATSSIKEIDDFYKLSLDTLLETLSLDGASLQFREIDKNKVLGSYSIRKDENESEIEPGEGVLDFKSQKGNIEGTLCVVETSSNIYSDPRILQTITNQITDAFHLVRSKAQEEKLKILNKDMQLAAQIQKNSLPIIPKTYGDLEIATYYNASRDVGGDFYDMIIHGPREVSFVIADVSGKGTPAALFMELSKTAIASEVSRTETTSDALNEANKVIMEKSGYFMFVTVMLLRINMDTKKVLFSSAGHNEQFIYSKSAKKITHLYGKGTPIGISKGSYSQEEFFYEKGDILLLYTDGVSECANEQDEFFGLDRMEDIIRENDDKSSQEIRDILVKETLEFQGKAEQHDDCTFVVVKL